MLTAHQVLHGYTIGIFPMADPDEDNQLFWYEPKQRGVLLLEEFHCPKNLKKLYEKGSFNYFINKNFDATIKACANREETWISEEIIDVYSALNQMGYAHSFEVYLDNELVGGLYGVALGKIFFGESMFHTVSNTSKLALCFLVEWLKLNHFKLLDCQFQTAHLKQFGVKELPQKDFLNLLKQALK